jgi:hypothetical protein
MLFRYDCFTNVSEASGSNLGKLDPLQQFKLSDAEPANTAGQQDVISAAMSTSAGPTECQTYARARNEPTI